MDVLFGPSDDERQVAIPLGATHLEGTLAIPAGAHGVVVFAHGSGSGRHSPRNRFVAQVLRNAGLGTLLFDLMTREEEVADMADGHLRFDIPFLAARLEEALGWLGTRPETADLPLGIFGASTGAGAALLVASRLPDVVTAVVSRGGRPDLAGMALASVKAPTLLVVGGEDDVVIDLNRQALKRLRGLAELVIVPGATHLFEEPGTLEAAAKLAAGWFSKHLQTLKPSSTPPETR
ncbi:MAG: dienelactone hydrolase-like enzyme [Cyanobacteria bacterium RYN_339]|nr:dienelactone hydrolase-like enzyme [Cyanobacteria bacterium RYN_339]